MVKLVLNGCQLSSQECGRVTSTVNLSSCAGGTIVDKGDTISDLTINSCLLELSYTDKDGVAQTKSLDISSCLPSVPISVTDLTNFTWNSTNGDTAITYIKSDGSVGTINTTILPTFTNTDNQQLTGDNTGSVLITLTPLPQPDGTTNYTLKADLKVAATTPSGGINGLKQDASGNFYVDMPDGSETKITGCAGTTVTGTGTSADPYVICATPATGAETKVQAGTNVTVTGTGTTADPYIVNAASGSVADGSETKVTAGTNITVIGSGTTASPYVVSSTQPVGQFVQLAPGGGGGAAVTVGSVLAFDTLVSSYGSLITPNATSSSMTLTAGYVYEIEANGLFLSGGTTTNLAFGIYDGTTLIGSQAYVQPVTHPTANQNGQNVAKAYVVATSSKTISVKAIQITGASTWQLQSPAFTGYGGSATNYNGTLFNGYFTAKVIGTI